MSHLPSLDDRITQAMPAPVWGVVFGYAAPAELVMYRELKLSVVPVGKHDGAISGLLRDAARTGCVEVLRWAWPNRSAVNTLRATPPPAIARANAEYFEADTPPTDIELLTLAAGSDLETLQFVDSVCGESYANQISRVREAGGRDSYIHMLGDPPSIAILVQEHQAGFDVHVAAAENSAVVLNYVMDRFGTIPHRLRYTRFYPPGEVNHTRTCVRRLYGAAKRPAVLDCIFDRHTRALAGYTGNALQYARDDADIERQRQGLVASVAADARTDLYSAVMIYALHGQLGMMRHACTRLGFVPPFTPAAAARGGYLDVLVAAYAGFDATAGTDMSVPGAARSTYDELEIQERIEHDEKSMASLDGLKTASLQRLSMVTPMDLGRFGRDLATPDIRAAQAAVIDVAHAIGADKTPTAETPELRAAQIALARAILASGVENHRKMLDVVLSRRLEISVANPGPLESIDWPRNAESMWDLFTIESANS